MPCERRLPYILIVTPGGGWFRGQRIACTIGRGGATHDKREGDLATPTAEMTVTQLLYRPDRLAPPAPWATPIRFGDLWCDDPASPAYNRPVRAPFLPSHEQLRRADPMYDVILVLDWNSTPAIPGKGSAIFIHQLRRLWVPTAGCIAFRRTDLLRLAREMPPGSRVLVRYP